MSLLNVACRVPENTLGVITRLRAESQQGGYARVPLVLPFYVESFLTLL